MLSYFKNSICSFIALGLTFTACNENNSIKAYQAINNDTSILRPTYTLLCYGELPPPLYSNAKDIIGKQYNITFIDAAGCVVDNNLIDSIKHVNDITYQALKLIYKRDIEKEINARIEKENLYLTKLDNLVRSDAKFKNYAKWNNPLIYFTKKNNEYKGNVIVAEADYKVLVFKLKLILTIDSATKKLNNLTAKDSTINKFNDLQL